MRTRNETKKGARHRGRQAGVGPASAERNIVESALLEACRADFASFVCKCFSCVAPGTPFLPNWHIEAVAFHLEQVRLGKNKRLINNMPPRSLKSFMTSVAFPA